MSSIAGRRVRSSETSAPLHIAFGGFSSVKIVYYMYMRAHVCAQRLFSMCQCLKLPVAES